MQQVGGVVAVKKGCGQRDPIERYDWYNGKVHWMASTSRTGEMVCYINRCLGIFTCGTELVDHSK